MKKSLLALAVSLAAASGAHASWFTGATPEATSAAANGEALLTVFDHVAGKSYGLDLGVRYDDLMSGAAFNGQSLAVDLSVFAGDYTNVQWMVTNSSAQYFNDALTDTQFDKYGFMLTTVQSATRTAQANPDNQFLLISTFQGELTNVPNAQLGMYTGPVSQNVGVSAANSGAATYIGGADWGTYFNSQTGISALGAVGGTLKLTVFGFTDAAGQNSFAQDLGTITLTANTITFNQAAAPAVPVPGAAWLMGSALLGLSGIGRSRRAK
ncbi:MAG TPA: VPLPA-CTERM sorting domain-containing protein [Spongiibacteraceae bacterium]|nr:VPLPA-CTERM sorting domain-containing protein [Spongiibacteraceae bacterium]